MVDASWVAAVEGEGTGEGGGARRGRTEAGRATKGKTAGQVEERTTENAEGMQREKVVAKRMWRVKGAALGEQREKREEVEAWGR